MTINPIIAVTSRVLSLLETDNLTKQAFITHIDQIQAQTELAFEAINAISQTIVYSQQQVSLVLDATQTIDGNFSEAGLEEKEYLAYSQMLQHEYLCQMAAIVHKAADAIIWQVGQIEDTRQPTVVYMQIRG